MKRLFILILCVVSTSLFAQKGSIYLGGALFFSDGDYRIAPEGGTWLSEKLQLGAVISYESFDTQPNATTALKPHVYLRRFFPIGERFSIYGGANVRYVSLEGPLDDSSDSYVDAFIDLGFAYSLAERWGVVGRVASIGQIDEEFLFDFDMSKQPLFNVGIYYTIKQ